MELGYTPDLGLSSSCADPEMYRGAIIRANHREVPSHIWLEEEWTWTSID